MPRGLAEVLDQYLEPGRPPPAEPFGERRILVPALPGDATVASLTLALSRRLRASGVSCGVRGLDTRARALCVGGADSRHPAPEVALCLATEPAHKAAATLLFLLPGWELRAELLQRAESANSVPLWVLKGDPAGGGAAVRWLLAPFGLVPSAVECLASPLAAALDPPTIRPDKGLDALARRLGSFARWAAHPHVADPPVAFPLPRNAAE